MDRRLLSNLNVGITIPLLASLYSGVLGSLVGLTAGLLVGADDLALWALLPGAGAAALTWFGLVGAWRQAVYPQEGQPAEVKQAITRLTVISDGGSHGERITFAGVTADQLHTLAAGLAAGAPLSVSYWCGRNAAFSRSEFERMRQVLVDRGLVRARGRGPQQGFELTTGGRHAFRALAAHPLPGADGLK